jgi:LmbE family N-acetylglucosaminyl deacetylase
MRYLFFCAHPDDLEFYVSNLLIEVARNPNNHVKIISMTRGEFGTPEPSLMGKKLRQIRAQEFRSAAKVEGITDLQILEYIDTRVEVNRATVQRVKNVINQFNPDIIIAPEGIYSYYPHTDHVKTGFIVYIIVKKMAKKSSPKLITYHSYVNTHYFPMIHWKRQSKALRMHKSQTYLLALMNPIRFLLGFYFGFQLPLKNSFFPAEAVRKIDFHLEHQRKLRFKQRVIRAIVFKINGLFNRVITARVKE